MSRSQSIKRMRVLQVGMSFYPDRGGGEAYVGTLARELFRRNTQVLIVAPGKRDECYVYKGLQVQRIASEQSTYRDLRTLYAPRDQEFARKFASILDEERPDIVHLHARTRELSLNVAHEVKRRGIPLLFTYHIATTSCLRGDLLRWGNRVCDGVLDSYNCSRCFLHKLGLRRPFADLLAAVPPYIGEAVGRQGLVGKVSTALRMRELVLVYHSCVSDFFGQCDIIVTLCQWVRNILVRNGVPTSKIIFSQLGLCYDLDEECYIPRNKSPQRRRYSQIRCAFVGRFHPSKGPHILIQALKSAPDLKIDLDLFGVTLGEESASYCDYLHVLAANDPRIRFRGPLSNVVEHLVDYDILAVPSQGLETGPLVVLEALAAGIPVVASDLCAINELVEHEVNGMLVDPFSPTAWACVLRQLCLERNLLIKLGDGTNPPRTMGQVADEMIALYTQLSR